MAGWTKADFDASYSFRVERYMGSHPSRAGRLEVRINYHEWSMKPIMVERWRNLLPLLSPAIGVADRVIVVGAGFGWGVRALKKRIGCAAVGTDTSPYIQASKNSDDRAEIEAKITAVGLDPATGRGLDILNFVRTIGNRAKELVLDEDMASVQSRQNVAAVLGGSPTWIIMEDLVTDATTDAEILVLANNFNQSSARKLWLYSVTTARSAQALATLTGHRVITTGTFEMVTP